MENIELYGINVDGVEKKFSLNSFKHNTLVLYFYPKDNTSGCTTEACNFRDNLNRISAKATLVGVSPDSLTSHKKFHLKQNLNFVLLSDTEHLLAQQFKVWKEKSLYGKKYMGIERSTFVLDKNARIVREWRKVKVAGHVDEVLDFLNKFEE